MLAHAPQFQAHVATTEDDIRNAQRLRYRVFVEELGADVESDAGIELDRFDQYADQLVLKDVARPEGDQIVGVYRLMNAQQAADAKGFSSDAEYDLDALRATGRTLLELSRSCLHPDYRGGTAMFHLWQALSEQFAERKVEILFGVASFHGADADAHSGPLNMLFAEHGSSISVPSRQNVALKAQDYDKKTALKATPSLIKAYLRLGGKVGQGAFVDRKFNTTDVCMILETDQLNARQRAIYAR